MADQPQGPSPATPPPQPTGPATPGPFQQGLSRAGQFLDAGYTSNRYGGVVGQTHLSFGQGSVTASFKPGQPNALGQLHDAALPALFPPVGAARALGIKGF